MPTDDDEIFNNKFTEEELREIDGEPDEDEDDDNEHENDSELTKKGSKKTKKDTEKALQKQIDDIFKRCEEIDKEKKQRAKEKEVPIEEVATEISTKKITIRVTMPENAAHEAADILSETGIDLCDAIRLYVGQIILQQGIPYEGFKSQLRPKSMAETRKDQRRELIAEAMRREYKITKNRRDIKYYGGIPPVL